MENATKALIISAAVLIAIVIIALGILLLKGISNTSKQSEDVGKTISEATNNASKKIMGGTTHKWTRSGDTFTCSDCGESYTIGDQVAYTPGETSKASIKVSASDSGYTSDQTITRPSDLSTLKWIVLGVDKDGTLLITTSQPQGRLYLKGAKAYLNGPSIMNDVCEKLYSNDQYGKARSINIDDINSVLNYTDTRGIVYSSSGDKYRVNKGTKFGEIGTGKMVQEDWETIVNAGNTQTPDGKALTEYEIDGYTYKVAKIAGGLLESIVVVGNYWLASRGAFADSRYGIVRFGPGWISAGYVRMDGWLFKSSGGGNLDFSGLRPVVPLKSALPEKQ